jgi:hypothetical protein
MLGNQVGWRDGSQTYRVLPSGECELVEEGGIGWTERLWQRVVLGGGKRDERIGVPYTRVPVS